MAQAKPARMPSGWAVWTLLLLGVLFYILYFVHLRADFPVPAPWQDRAESSDEGWYGGAAIQYFAQGQWFLPGSFNPAIALPVWPAMLAVPFFITGMSVITARALTVVLFGVSTLLLALLIRREEGLLASAAALALVLLSPFCYAFNRMAILEPVLVFWMMLGLWIASAPHNKQSTALRPIALGVIFCLLALTKTTGVCLIPALLYQQWASAGFPRRGWLRPIVISLCTAAGLGLAYFFLCVRPHFLADFRLLFSVNRDRIHLGNALSTGIHMLHDGLWMDRILFPAALVLIALSLFWLRPLWKKPLFGSSILAICGYLGFIWYHGNLQPRYYLVVMMPLIAVIVLGTEELYRQQTRWPALLATAALLCAGVLMMAQTLRFALHPQYSFISAAQDINRIVRADTSAPPLLMGGNAGDITLLSGLPSVCETYTTNGLDALLARYRPHWFVAWSDYEKDTIAQIGQRYRLVETARYSIFGRPDGNTLVLYRLEPR